MPHMTHNYMLGLAVLLVSFVVLFYAPIAYFWVQAAKQQRKQNKSCANWSECTFFRPR